MIYKFKTGGVVKAKGGRKVYNHNDYYGYINKIQEKAISNPRWFWSDAADASEVRQWLYNNGASAIVDNIYDNTPEDIQKTISYKKLSNTSGNKRMTSDIHDAQNKFLDTAGAIGLQSAGILGGGIGIALAPEITIPAIIGGVAGAKATDSATNKLSKGKYNTWGEFIRGNNDWGQTGNLLTEFTNPGGWIGGSVGSMYGKGIKAAIPVFKNTKAFYNSKGVNSNLSNKLAITNAIWELPLHKAISTSKLGKIGTYYLLRANGGDASGTSVNLKSFVDAFITPDKGKWGITDSNLKDNYKLGLFRDDPLLSKMFHLSKVKYKKINTPEAIKANQEIGELINSSIPENVPGNPVVNNTDADIFELTINPEQKVIYRKRPSYRTKKFKAGWIPVGSSKSISRTHVPFLLETNADLGGHWEKGLLNEPVQVYDWNHFTPLNYSKKWDESGMFQIYALTGLNRMWKPFAFYGKSPLTTRQYLHNSNTLYHTI